MIGRHEVTGPLYGTELLCFRRPPNICFVQGAGIIDHIVHDQGSVLPNHLLADMALVPGNHEIQALPPYGSNQSLAKSIRLFLRNHREAIAAMDFFAVPTLTFGDPTGPGIPERRCTIEIRRTHRHRFEDDEVVVAKPILGGLHHEYNLRMVAA